MGGPRPPTPFHLAPLIHASPSGGVLIIIIIIVVVVVRPVVVVRREVDVARGVAGAVVRLWLRWQSAVVAVAVAGRARSASLLIPSKRRPVV